MLLKCYCIAKAQKQNRNKIQHTSNVNTIAVALTCWQTKSTHVWMDIRIKGWSGYIKTKVGSGPAPLHKFDHFLILFLGEAVWR